MKGRETRYSKKKGGRKGDKRKEGEEERKNLRRVKLDAARLKKEEN